MKATTAALVTGANKGIGHDIAAGAATRPDGRSTGGFRWESFSFA